ncbi:MAG: alpha/beta hydrolase [Actinomycetota bacterium]|nr:alpha/beta hydrolase [Actinomycetota bacterium]
MPSLVRPDGCRLHYELAGDPGSQALVLLEGIGGDIAGWRRNIPTLATALRVAIEHRGNGRGDERTPLRSVLRGMVAQEAALTHADRVRTLVLAGTHPGPAHAIAVADRTVPKGEPWRALYAPGFPELHPDAVADDLRAMAAQPDHPHGQRREWEAMQAWDDFDRLPRTTVPTLVLHGTEDQVVAPGNAELLARRIPDFIDRHRDA